MSHKGSGFDEVEALIYRLFAEKQFALALLALVMVAQLLSAQFLLLRMKPPASQGASAPAAANRLDVACEPAGPRTLAGAPLSADSARGKVVVMHLGAAAEACLSQMSGASELVVGITADASH